MELNTSELKKIFPPINFKKYRDFRTKKNFNSKILIIGAGGLGCPLLLYLAYSGAGNLRNY